MRPTLAAVATLVACLATEAAPDEPVAARQPTRGAAPSPVVGVATIEGSAVTAVMRWTYEKDGVQVETTSPPKMVVTRLSANVPLMMVKLPNELFGVRIGQDLQRILESPLLVDTKGEATCSCRMRDDCGSGKTFRCEVEAWLLDGEW
jgi:hypothetical protein